MVVDDDADIRDVLRDVLELLEGYDFLAAHDGDTGLATLLAMSGPCVLILDLDLPGKCGEDVLRALGSNGSDRIVTVICSARSDRFVTLPNGAFEAIAKPFDIHTIINAVARGFLHLEAIGHRFDK